MTSLYEKANDIIFFSDFNDLPYEERKRISKYRAEEQIITIMLMIEKDKDHTTAAWKKKQMKYLENVVNSYRSEWGR